MNGKIEIRVAIDATPRVVFDALTTESALETWFAESADVSRDEKRYDFWGRFTPYAPARNDGRHTIISWTDGSRLEYGWHLRGADSVVTVAVERDGGGARLELTHDAPDRATGELSLADFWMLSFENLRRFVRNGAPPVRCDYSASPRGTVALQLDVDAPPSRVFEGLTDPDMLRRWMSATAAEVEPVAGGTYRYWEGQGPVQILEIVPDRKLSCRWAMAGDPETVVSWTLDGSEGRTRIALVHSGFGRVVEDLRTGWLKHLLWLEQALEQGSSWSPPLLLTTDCRA